MYRYGKMYITAQAG